MKTINLRGLRGDTKGEGLMGDNTTIHFNFSNLTTLRNHLKTIRCWESETKHTKHFLTYFVAVVCSIFRMGSFMGNCCSLNLCSDFPRVTQIFSLFWKEIFSKMENTFTFFWHNFVFLSLCPLCFICFCVFSSLLVFSSCFTENFVCLAQIKLDRPVKY